MNENTDNYKEPQIIDNLNDIKNYDDNYRTKNNNDFDTDENFSFIQKHSNKTSILTDIISGKFLYALDEELIKSKLYSTNEISGLDRYNLLSNIIIKILYKGVEFNSSNSIDNLKLNLTNINNKETINLKTISNSTGHNSSNINLPIKEIEIEQKNIMLNNKTELILNKIKAANNIREEMVRNNFTDVSSINIIEQQYIENLLKEIKSIFNNGQQSK